MHTKPLRKEGEINWSENSPNLMKNINIHMEEPQLTLSRLNKKKFTLRHIIIKLFKKNKKNLESNKREVTYHLQRIIIKKISWFVFHRDHGGLKATGWYVQWGEIKKPINQEFYIQQKYLSKLRCFQIDKRLKEPVTPIRNVKRVGSWNEKKLNDN